MSKLRLLAYMAAAFAAGIAFVLACSDDDNPLDAGIDAHAATCDQCEPPITSERIYQVRDTANQRVPYSGDPSSLWSFARCDTGDVLLGGGCWITYLGATSALDNLNNWHLLIDSGPMPAIEAQPADQTVYACGYEDDEEGEGIIVIATAICFKPLPPAE
jgi:hypothetical protein